MNRRAKELGLSLIGAATLLAAWASAAATLQSPFLPRLDVVAKAFADNWLFERVLSDVVPSLTRLGLGFVLAVTAGVLIGTAMGLVRWVAIALEPVVEFARALPKIAIIPLFLVILGTGDRTKILVIAMAATVPVLLNALDGTRSLDPVLQQLAQVYRFSKWQRIGMVLRWSSPQVFAGARTALALAFILVTSEMVAYTNGIGHFVLVSQRTFVIPDMWSGMLLLGVLGLLFNAVFVTVERRLMAWHRGFKATQLDGG
ncbi:MAG: ABC transporter permease subunit [Pseudonocardiaceae bacterium]|nr:ABC transporter permease subunit [Pseudonocardiaceae bacterium]